MSSVEWKQTIWVCIVIKGNKGLVSQSFSQVVGVFLDHLKTHRELEMNVS